MNDRNRIDQTLYILSEAFAIAGYVLNVRGNNFPFAVKR